MNSIIIDPRQQFSKWLARWTAVFWFFYMVYIAAIMIVRPETADAVVYLAVIASFVMTVNVAAYTRNSIYEKAIRAGAEIGKNGITWKPWKKEEAATTTEEKEGGENG